MSQAIKSNIFAPTGQNDIAVPQTRGFVVPLEMTGLGLELEDYLPDTGVRSPVLRAMDPARGIGRRVMLGAEVGHSLRSAGHLAAGGASEGLKPCIGNDMAKEDEHLI